MIHTSNERATETVLFAGSVRVCAKLGVIKDRVYVPPLPADIPDLRHRTEAAVARISSDTLKKVWDELAYRLDMYRVTNGAHTEHL
ncbi:uncharacterized protein TNCV_738731 [Trichonephila clavipes]|nr:uncharacterized protein TNCV_738731 [Trichonephila clavipes]